MRKLIVSMIAMVIFANTYAQISDTDAKLQYQEITETYENAAYYKAAQMAEDLKIKMGRWTPKVLYMYLQSVYKNYTETKQVLTGKYPIDYKYFTSFKNTADSFFLLIDKANYPQEKYNDMVTAQQYFQQMMQKYQYQINRTPEKALAFLNKCAEEFPNPYAGGEPAYLNNNIIMFTHDTMYAKYHTCVGNYIHFRIDSGYLHIITINKTLNRIDKKLSSIIINYDMIDLYHTPSTDEASAANFEQSYCYLHQDIYFQKDVNNVPKEDTLLPRRTGVDKFEFLAFCSGCRPNGPCVDCLPGRDRVISRTVSRIAIRFPILSSFDETNKEFIEGNYAERITEAYNYLLNYYPKEKSVQQPAKKEEDKKDGF